MKIVAILEADVSWGGGFNQALNAIVQMRDLCRERFDFEVLTTLRSNIEALRSVGVPAESCAFSLADRVLALLSQGPWWRPIQVRLQLTGPFERMLVRRGCDLAYFVMHSGKTHVLQQVNFIVTLHDLCHRDAVEFPEVRAFGEFQARERYFQSHLAGAVAVLTDSEALADSAARRYGLDRERLLAMPFAPAPFMWEGAANAKTAVLGKYGLAEGYLFYPAQLWAHKNHVRIVEALALLKDRELQLLAVFAGGDKGNRQHVENVAQQLGVHGQIRMLGFVPAPDMRGLYEGCSAVVMPTYFGPTNLPPLEAWLAGKPLVYSKPLTEHAGEAAVCADPDDAQDLARAIQEALEPANSARLIAAGRSRLLQIERQRATAEAELVRRLQRFAARRQCWE